MEIATAEEFLKGCPPEKKEIQTKLIEFAKLHVEAALKAASRKVRMYQGDSMARYSGEEIDKSTILSAYPLTNIK